MFSVYIVIEHWFDDGSISALPYLKEEDAYSDYQSRKRLYEKSRGSVTEDRERKHFWDDSIYECMIVKEELLDG